ncbi:MAG: xylanase [Lachnospiraceae bacterium]|nr:xylanase [Lachnospiraceae bacterium]
MKGSYYTKRYSNSFERIGIDEGTVLKRLDSIFDTLFYGSEDERIYHPVGEDMGYMEDTGNIDARTEGMSYGMMFCVQMDKQEEFDCIWKWSKTYMYMDEGTGAGYFAWSVDPSGVKNAYGPAPDGEEFFAMALILASHRWGDKEGIFNYSHEAKELLHTMIHKEDEPGNGRNMWDLGNGLIRFIPEVDFTDPSYHLPHFYELFSENCYPEDSAFYKKAANASREYLHLACDEKTGMSPEYSHYDGSPYLPREPFGRHDWFYSDAYRTIPNMVIDQIWFGTDEWQKDNIYKLQKFLDGKISADHGEVYLTDGTKIEGTDALHPVGLLASVAEGSAVTDGELSDKYLKLIWDMPLRTGVRRYYDNCLYFFAFLALSGRYRIY